MNLPGTLASGPRMTARPIFFQVARLVLDQLQLDFCQAELLGFCTCMHMRTN